MIIEFISSPWDFIFENRQSVYEKAYRIYPFETTNASGKQIPVENKFPSPAWSKNETVSIYAGNISSAAAVVPCSLTLWQLKGDLPSLFNHLGKYLQL